MSDQIPNPMGHEPTSNQPIADQISNLMGHEPTSNQPIADQISNPIEHEEATNPTPSKTPASTDYGPYAATFAAVCAVYFADHCPTAKRSVYEQHTLDFILQLAAVDLPEWAARTLRKGIDEEVVIPRADAAVIFASGFAGKIVRHSFKFASLANTMKGGVLFSVAKFDCFFHYFEILRSRVAEVLDKNPSLQTTYEALRAAVPEYLCFRRQTRASREKEFWQSCDTPLCKFAVNQNGKIEDDAEEMLQIDFANKYIGGGVLTHGCVQEEIRFSINPEYIISMYFVEGHMSHEESIAILGAERFCNYSGYRDTFRFSGPYEDKVGTIQYDGRTFLNVSLSAIDALPGLTLRSQFSEEIIIRELNKASTGFAVLPWEKEAKTVATGNWGCGVFGGNIQLKSMIQWMAASVADRSELLYFSFQDAGAAGLEQVCKEIQNAKWTVKELWQAITKYNPDTWATLTLFESIMISLGKKDAPRAATLIDQSSSTRSTPPQHENQARRCALL